MKSTGIVRRVDDLGRVVIPKEIRRTLGIGDGDPVEFYVDGDTVVLRKYVVGCLLCGSKDRLVEVSKVQVCKSCINDLAKNYLD